MKLMRLSVPLVIALALTAVFLQPASAQRPAAPQSAITTADVQRLQPSASINGVDARYVPFRARSLVRPRALTLVFVDQSGALAYAPVAAGQATLRERASGASAGGGR